MGAMTTAAAIARETTSPRFADRMVLVRAYRKLNRVFHTNTYDIPAQAFHEFVRIINLAQHLLRTEVELSGGDFDALYEIAILEEREQ